MSARLAAAGTVALLTVTGLTAIPAQVATTASAKFLLRQLDNAAEHPTGYERSKFTHWTDADGDSCDARDEVLIAEAVTDPTVRSGCTLAAGKWRSRYDGVVTTDPSTFDIDHMVPLNEAWQSGAWAWNTPTPASGSRTT